MESVNAPSAIEYLSHVSKETNNTSRKYSNKNKEHSLKNFVHGVFLKTKLTVLESVEKNNFYVKMLLNGLKISKIIVLFSPTPARNKFSENSLQPRG